MGDIEKILTDAEVRPTSNRIMVMREIIAMDHTFTLSEMEERLGRFACALYMYFLWKDLLYQEYRYLFHPSS